MVMSALSIVAIQKQIEDLMEYNQQLFKPEELNMIRFKYADSFIMHLLNESYITLNELKLITESVNESGLRSRHSASPLRRT